MRSAILIAGAALALGSGAYATGSGASLSSDERLTCSIEAKRGAGSIALTGIVRAAEKLSGEYHFRVASSGGGNSTNISQGGAFIAVPGSAAILGEVMLGANGTYKAELKVTADGVTVTCAERIGGRI